MAQENKECLKIVKDFYKDVLTVFPEYKDKLEDFKNKNIMIIKNEMYNYLNVDLVLEIKENSIDEVYQLIWNHVIDEFL